MPTVLGDRKECVMSKSRRRRDTTDIANRRLPVSKKFAYDYKTRVERRVNPYLSQIEDRRTWHPEGSNRPARSFNKSRHRLVSNTPDQPVNRNVERSSGYSNPYLGFSDSVPIGVGFEDPSKVLVCVRRKMRREVLHALKVAGKSGGQQTPRFNAYSKIFCRRK